MALADILGVWWHGWSCLWHHAQGITVTSLAEPGNVREAGPWDSRELNPWERAGNRWYVSKIALNLIRRVLLDSHCPPSPIWRHLFLFNPFSSCLGRCWGKIMPAERLVVELMGLDMGCPIRRYKHAHTLIIGPICRETLHIWPGRNIILQFWVSVFSIANQPLAKRPAILEQCVLRHLLQCQEKKKSWKMRLPVVSLRESLFWPPSALALLGVGGWISLCD